MRGVPFRAAITGEDAPLNSDFDEGVRDERKASPVSRIPPEAPIFVFYVLVAFFLTWPVIMRFTTSAYGFPSDNLGTMWLWWWIRNAGSFGHKASFCPLIGFPFGTHLNLFPFEPVIEIVERFLLLFLNEVVVYNLLIISSFFFSGITMYYLVRYLTGDRQVAFFGGFVYMISVYHAYNAMIFAHLALIEFMPLFVLALVRFIRGPTRRSALWLWLAGVLVAGTCMHYGFFMVLFTIAFVPGYFIHRWLAGRRSAVEGEEPGVDPPTVDRRVIVLALLVAAGIAALTLPFYYVSTSRAFPPGQWPTRSTYGTLRVTESYEQGSARTKDYLLPNRENRLVGRVTEKLADGSINAFENSLYVGWVVIVLAVLAVAVASSRRKPREPAAQDAEGEPPGPVAASLWRERFGSAGDRAVVWGVIAAAAFTFILSLPPYVHLGSMRVPMPSLVFTRTTAWFRWYMRLGIVVFLCLVLLACYGLTWVLRGMKKFALPLVVALMVIAFLEMTLVPPFKYFEFGTVPKVYSYIEGFPQDQGLVFYPAFEPGYFNSQQYMFYQRTFKKPMLNAANDNSDGEALRRTVYNPYNPEVPGILSRFGITHVVYLGEMFKQYEGTDTKEIEVTHLPGGLHLEKRFVDENIFGDAFVYGVTATRSVLVPIYQGDITVPHMDRGRVTVRLSDGDGVIKIENYSERPVTARIRIPVSNLVNRHGLTLTAGGRTLWRGELTGDEATEIVTELEVPSRGVDLHLLANGASLPMTSQELYLFGTEKAKVKISDVSLEPR
jgi:hypothetical protein